MKIRKLLFGLAIIVIILASILAPVIKVLASDTLYEYFNTGADAAASIYHDYVGGQTFTPQISHNSTSVKVKLYRTGSPGNISLFLFATSGGLPISPILASKTQSGNAITTDTSGEWVEFVWESSYQLNAGTKYCILLEAASGDSSNRIHWIEDQTSPTYTRGNAVWSTDGAVTFTAYTGIDFYFEEYGTPIVTLPTVTTQGATSITGTTATGNGTITSTGGGIITKRGVVYSSTDTTPTIAEGASYVEEIGSFSPGAFTESVTGLSVGVNYYMRAYAYNSAGYGYGNVISFMTTLQPPVIVSINASNITKFTARLNSLINSDGGEQSEVRFGYGTTSQSQANFENYDTVTDWISGYTTGQAPYIDISGLSASETYYFRVQIRNSAGTFTSVDERVLNTLDAVLPVAEFKAIPSTTSVSLQWIKGEGASQTLIRYDFGAYPTTISDGYSVYFGVGTSFVHTGLTAGTTIYYTVWAYDDPDYSSPINLMITTTAGVTTTVVDDNPMSSSYWFQSPDYTRMSGLEPIYTFINGIADAYGTPRATVWVMFTLAVCSIIGLGTWLSSGSALAGAIALFVAMCVGVGLHLLQFWMVFFSIMMIGGILIQKRDWGGAF